MELKDAKPGCTLNIRREGNVFPVIVKRVTKRGIITIESGERFNKRGVALLKHSSERGNTQHG